MHEPQEYLPFKHLMNQDQFTSVFVKRFAGIEIRNPITGNPVLVMRDTTERPEAVVAGTLKLVSTALQKIVAETHKLLDDPVANLIMARALNPYGDGLAFSRIVAAIRSFKS